MKIDLLSKPASAVELNNEKHKVQHRGALFLAVGVGITLALPEFPQELRAVMQVAALLCALVTINYFAMLVVATPFDTIPSDLQARANNWSRDCAVISAYCARVREQGRVLAYVEYYALREFMKREDEIMGRMVH